MFRLHNKLRTHVCKDCELMPCTSCSLEKPLADFDAMSVCNFFRNQQRVVCNACKALGCSGKDPQLYSCTRSCGQRKGSKYFDSKQLLAYKHGSGRRLICNVCVVADGAREARLKALMISNKRKRCTCRQLLQHSERCPMHPRKYGEKPYPGMDVMSRADSEWLAEKLRQNA